MDDMEKVIKGLKCCCGTGMCFHGCPYYDASKKINECTSQLALEALDLLKEQEAKIEQLNRFINGFSRDAMPVVRCKNCKYCEYPKSEKEWCKKGHLHGKAETWFCADGDRR